MKRIFQIGILVAIASVALGGCVTTASNPIGPVQAAAESGDPDSQYQLGLRYLNGYQVGQNYGKAAEWLERAADNGHVRAQYQTGINYSTGRGVASDYAKAATWYEKAARNGNAEAQYQLGDAHLNARGVPRERAWALRWMGKAAATGHRDAQKAVGIGFATGLGLPKQPDDAWVWLRLAELAGDADAGKARARIESALAPRRLDAARDAVAKFAPAATVSGTALDDAPTIRFVQFALSRLGWPDLAVDGVAGPRTSRALAEYAAARGLGAGLDDAVVMALRTDLRAQDPAS